MLQKIEGTSCVLRDNCHSILQAIGYQDKHKRKSLIAGIKLATDISSLTFPSPDILQVVKEWKGQRLIASNYQYPRILKELGSISLQKVQVIIVKDNYIASIQGLGRVEAPNLKSLYLSNNRITTLNELRKVQWPKLEGIFLGGNFVMDTSTLVYLQGRVKVIGTQTHSPFQRDIQRWQAKIESRFLQELNVRSHFMRKKINLRNRLKAALNQRFYYLIIYD